MNNLIGSIEEYANPENQMYVIGTGKYEGSWAAVVIERITEVGILLKFVDTGARIECSWGTGWSRIDRECGWRIPLRLLNRLISEYDE